MSAKLKLFDTHCHIDAPQFADKLDAMMRMCELKGIGAILIPGVERAGWRHIRQVAARFEICHTALGLHPVYTANHKESDLHDLEMALSVGPIAAVGEIGLDYYIENPDKSAQLRFFKAQIEIAKSARLPVVLHVRKAHDEVLQVLKQSYFTLGGIVHAFNGSEVQAERYLEKGFKLGFGGAMTYPRAIKLRAMAQTLPLNSIVLETDAPDMPPVTCKLEYNTPLHIFDNLRCLAELRQESIAKIVQQTTLNAHQALRLPMD